MALLSLGPHVRWNGMPRRICLAVLRMDPTCAEMVGRVECVTLVKLNSIVCRKTVTQTLMVLTYRERQWGNKKINPMYRHGIET